MVFYDITIIEAQSGLTGKISFLSLGKKFSSRLITPTNFLFETAGQLLPAEGSTTVPFWEINDNPNDLSLYPPDTFFQTGDCIHIVNTDALPANLQIGDPPLATKILASGADTWILWKGIQSQFSDTPCCVHPDTMVMTLNGSVPIKDIKKNDKVLDHQGNFVNVARNIKCIAVKDFVKIGKDSIEKDRPNCDLLIRETHPILIDDKEILPRKLVKEQIMNIQNIKLDKAEYVWTLCTKTPNYVMMNNVPVGTWGNRRWTNHANKKGIIFWEY